MCTIRLEDDTGSIEVIAFQRVLDQSNAYLEENTAVAVSGRISLRDEKDPQLMADRREECFCAGDSIRGPGEREDTLG